mmetsp:Transcript_11963/g.21137  ORF Transcript_11963/g.21137 Transcript_11963/m.21137 type:complete len:232 (-) Transcript_11963:128-823(-)
MLAVGGAALPVRGMRAIPEQLAASLQQPVQLATSVEAVKPRAVKVKGTWKDYDAVVLATEWPMAAKLLPGISQSEGTSSATWYFGLLGLPPVLEPMIVLQSYGPQEKPSSDSRIVNIGFPSTVHASYAPPGHSLAAVTVMGPDKDEAWVRGEVETILGVDCSSWRHLRTYQIAFHQPSQFPLRKHELLAPQVEDVFCCGDHRSYPTLDGAMRSGRRTAEALLAEGKRRKLR